MKRLPDLRVKERIKNLFSKIRNYIVKSKLWKLLLFIGIPVNITMLSWFTPAIDVTKEFGRATYLYFTLDNDYVLLKEFSSSIPSDPDYGIMDSLAKDAGIGFTEWVKKEYPGNCATADSFNFKPGYRIVFRENPCWIEEKPKDGILKQYEMIYNHRDVVWTFRDSIPPIMIKGEIARKGEMKKYVIVNNPITGERWHRDASVVEKLDNKIDNRHYLMTGVGYDSVFVNYIWRVYEPKVFHRSLFAGDDLHEEDRKQWEQYGEDYQGWIRMKDVEGNWWNLWMTDKFGWLTFDNNRGKTMYWYEEKQQWYPYYLGGNQNPLGTGGHAYFKDHPDSIIKWEQEMKSVRIAP